MRGKELREIRGWLKLTQAELAARIGVSPSTIRRWEADRVTSREPFMQLLELMDTLNIPRKRRTKGKRD